jgi:hypothetical protein
MRLSLYTKSIIISAVSIIFVISGTQTLQNAEAQQQGAQQQVIPQMPQQPGAQLPQPGVQSPPVPFSNFTASIPLATSLFDVMKSKINVDLADAMTNVTNSLGMNATVLDASVQSERGFLVYRIAALDSENNIHMILVDPANGSTLLQRQWPAAMPGVFSSIPGMDPQFGDVPRLRIP